MKVKTYTFKPGARLKTKIKPNELNTELERIRRKRGLTNRAIVDESTDKKAKLHGEFTWDDKVAADKFRLEEAGNIVRVLQVVYEVGPDEPQRAIQIQEHIDGEANYAPVHVVLERQSSRDQLILELLRDLQSFRRRFALVSELSHVVPMLDDAINSTQSAIASQ